MYLTLLKDMAKIFHAILFEPRGRTPLVYVTVHEKPRTNRATQRT